METYKSSEYEKFVGRFLIIGNIAETPAIFPRFSCLPSKLLLNERIILSLSLSRLKRFSDNFSLQTLSWSR